MTLELVVAPPPSAVATMLEDLLDREWAAQSDRTAALQPTPIVRELVELARGGMFGARIGPAASPRELVQQLGATLPAQLSPWTLRALRRASTLRPPRQELGPAVEPPRLAAPPPAAPPIVPDLPPATQELAPVVEPPAPAAMPRRRARTLALALGLGVGAALGGAAALLSVSPLAAGALAGLLGAVVARST